MSQVQKRAISGKCLCGAVSFTANASVHEDGKVHVGACHCSMCRTWSGGVLLAVEDASDLQITGEDALSVYKSSEWGERCFCRTCGSNLLWRSPTLNVTAVVAGCLVDPQSLSLAKEIFIDHKPAYFNFAEPTEKLTEAEFLAMIAPPAP